METGARYTLIGLFTLAVIAAGFAFVYWLHNIGGVGERTTYQVAFEDGASGLRPGSSVLFNGMRVGEVTALRFAPESTRGVIATIAVERATPIRADTQVGVETQGLMGTPAISLKGGDPAAPALPQPTTAGTYPTLTADPEASQDTLQAARTVLRQVNTILSDNAEPLRTTIANLKVFTDALARNSDKIDGIITGVERMTGGGTPKAPPTTFELTAPRDLPPLETVPNVQLVVADPTAVVALETQRLLIGTPGGENSTFPDSQWADTLPRMIQSRIVQSFENVRYKRVSRPFDTDAPDFRLMIDLRAFRVLQTAEPVAEIEFGAKLAGSDGKIIDARVFRATVPASTTDVQKAVAALNQAFGQTMRELIPWTVAAL